MLLDMLWILPIVGAILCCIIAIVLTFLAGASDRCWDRQQQAKDYETILSALLEKMESQEKNRGKSENSENS